MEKPFYKIENKQELTRILISLFTIFAFYILGGVVMSLMKENIPNVSSNHHYIDDFKLYYGNNLTLIAILCPWVMAFFGAVFSSLFILKEPIAWYFSPSRIFDKKKILVSCFIWTGIYLLSLFIEGKKELVFIFDPEYFFILLIIAILFIPLQCLAEEILFRSLLFKLLGTFIPHGWMIGCISGMIFGLLHITNPEIEALGTWAIVFYIFAGVMLGILVILDNGIEIASGFHIANNLTAALIVTTNWQVFRTDALFLDPSEPHIDLVTFATMIGSMLLFFGLVFWRFNLKKGIPYLGKITKNR